MVPSLPLLSCELSVSVKENPDRKKKKNRGTFASATAIYQTKCPFTVPSALFIFFRMLLYGSRLFPEEAPSPHEVRPTLLDTDPVFQCCGVKWFLCWVFLGIQIWNFKQLKHCKIIWNITAISTGNGPFCITQSKITQSKKSLLT